MIEIRYSLSRTLNFWGALGLLGLAGLNGGLYAEGGQGVNLGLMWLLLGLGLGWLLVLALLPRRVWFANEQLTLYFWLGTQTLPYTAITTVSQSYWFITLKTATNTLRIPRLLADADAHFIYALEKEIPVAQNARAQRLAQNLPLVFKGKIGTPIVFTIISFGLLGGGLGLLWQALTTLAQWANTSWSVGLLIAGVCLALGARLLYWVLWTFPYRTVFTAEDFTQYFLARTLVWPMAEVTAFQTGYEKRAFRFRHGVYRRRSYHITFRYANGLYFKWIPDEFGFPLNYGDAAASYRVVELAEQLRRVYLPPTS